MRERSILLNGGMMPSGESTVVLSRHFYEGAEPVCVVRSEPYEEPQVFLKKIEVIRRSKVDPRVWLADELPVVLLYPPLHPISHIAQCPAVAYEGGQVRSQAVRKIMNSLKDTFRLRKHRVASVPENLLKILMVIDSNLVAVFVDRRDDRFQERVESSRQRRYLVQEETTKDRCVGLPKLHCLVALLLRYRLGVLRDSRGPFGCSVSNRGHPYRTYGCPSTDQDGRPIRPVSPCRFKRTELDCHKSSLLEPILP